MTDTLYIHQSYILPAAKGGKPTPVDVDGYAVISNDSLHKALCGIKDSLYHQIQIMDDLSAKVNDMLEYGMGFDDTISIIAIPLIIALFAFAFPFLFTVITHINNKYGSRSISEMFSDMSSYKLFWKANWIGVIYLAVYGVLYLIREGFIHNAVVNIGPWASLVVAIYYAFVILWFVKTCISFNSPLSLLEQMEKDYEIRLKIVNEQEKALERKEKRTKYKIWKSKAWKKYTVRGYRIGQIYSKHTEGEKYIDRLVDLCKYALDKGDERLFSNILLRANEVANQERKAHKVAFYQPRKGVKTADMTHLSTRFYNATLDYYLNTRHNSKVEERLLGNRYIAINESMFPADADLYGTVIRVSKAANQEHYTLLDKFVYNATYRYNYIYRMHDLAYISGEDVTGQEDTWTTSKEVWHRLREVLFVMAANLYSHGHYEILNTLLHNKYYDNGRLFPRTGAEIASCYNRCKSWINTKSWSNGWYITEMLGENFDPSLLEKYTVARLLLVPNDVEKINVELPEAEIAELKKNEKILRPFAEMAKKDGELIKHYSQVSTADFEKIYKEIIRDIESSPNLEEEKDVCLTKKLTDGLCGLVGRNKEKIKKTIYNVGLNAEIVDYFGSLVRNILRNKDNLGYGLNGRHIDGKDSEELFGEYSFHASKYLFVEPDDNAYYHAHNDFERLFQERYKSLLYTALSEMDEEVVTKNIAELDALLDEFDTPQDYVIIDTNSVFDALLELEQVAPLRYRYKGIDYICADWELNPHLRSLPVYERYEECLVVIKKNDLPVICDIDENNEAKVVIEDVSNKKDGISDVRITIKPNLKILYDKRSKILKVCHKRLVVK